MERSLLYQIGGPESCDLDGLVAQARLAEELGFHALWLLPAVDDSGRFAPVATQVWLGALAGRTTRLRLGWGVAGLAPPSEAPLRHAEQAATLDLASAGRLEVGLLPGGALVTTGDGGWDEGLRMLVEMWAGPSFSWTSARFTVPPVDVLPKPVQPPHPPLWLIGWTEEHALRAGTCGVGYLDVSGGTDAVLERHHTTYHHARAEAAEADLLAPARFAVAADPMPGPASTRREGMQRLAGWESMGVDEAVLHMGPPERDPRRASERIRAWASGDDRIH